MIRLFCATLLASSLLLAVSADSARAQGPSPYVRPTTNNPYYRPPLSPYLNLGLPGNAGINYYGLVRPQQAFASSIQQLRQQELQDAALLSGAASGQGAPITGVSSRFMNFSHYYGGRVAGNATLNSVTVPPVYQPQANVPSVSAILIPR